MSDETKRNGTDEAFDVLNRAALDLLDRGKVLALGYARHVTVDIGFAPLVPAAPGDANVLGPVERVDEDSAIVDLLPADHPLRRP
jgi:hypothetical protein